jgi:hypothetical protein
VSAPWGSAQQGASGVGSQLQPLPHKAEPGSQQLQGEVQEPELESLLGSAFVFDTITRVPKGEFGGDVLHWVVMNQTGAVCETILWESKRTKTYRDILDLVERGALRKDPRGGRSTSYSMAIDS